MWSAQYYKFNVNNKLNAIDVKSFVLFVVELRIFWRIFIQQQQQLLWAIKSEFRPSFSHGIDNRIGKDQRSKIPVRKYKQNIPVCVAERVLLNIKSLRQKRRCRSDLLGNLTSVMTKTSAA